MASGASRAEPVNVLLTSIGRRVELVRAFRQAYQELAIEGQLVATDVDPLAPALRQADRYYLVPPVTDADYIPTLAAICQREAIDLIFPLIDPDIPVLAAGRGELERLGARLATLEADAARTANDKWLTYQFLRSIDVPAPQSWDGPPPQGTPYPLFVKPRVGSAGKQAMRVEDAEQLQAALAQLERPLVQELLPGPEITNDVSCSLQGELWAVVSRRRIEVRWGEVAKGVTVHDPAIQQHCRQIAEALQARGPITVQCMLRDGQPYFTEINARFGGGLPLGIAAGIPSPRWYLAEAAGLQVEPPPLGSYQTGLYLTRYDQSYFITQSEYDEASGHRL